jgi:hypothetical protein
VRAILSFRNSIRLASHAALLLCLASATVFAGVSLKQDELPSYILPEHRAVLQSWLKERPELRPATEADADPEELKPIKEGYTGKPFQAFYAVADFNRDGQKDFAVGLVNREKAGSLILAVFNGPFKKGKAPASPAYYNDAKFDLSDFLILVGGNWDELQIGQGSDSRTVLLKPKGRGYYIWAGATQ